MWTCASLLNPVSIEFRFKTYSILIIPCLSSLNKLSTIDRCLNPEVSHRWIMEVRCKWAPYDVYVFVISIAVIFVSAKSRYVMKKPEGNVILDFTKCITVSITKYGLLFPFYLPLKVFLVHFCRLPLKKY